MRTTMSWILGAALLAGCGDSGATKSDFEAYCAEYCGWKDRCSAGSADCLGHCAAEGEGVYAKARSTAVRAIADCFKSATACGSDDACFEAGVRAVAPDPLADAHLKQCMDARAGCAESPFSDDICATVIILTDSAQAELEACYAKPCEQMGACVQAAWGPPDDSANDA